MHDLLGRIRFSLGLADDADDLVERVEDLLEALENVDALVQPVELVLQTIGHDLEPEVQEVPEDRVQIALLRPPDLGILRRHERRQVDDDVGLERGVLEQIRHHHPRVRVLLQLQRNPHIVGGHVLDVEQRRKLARQHDIGDALDESRFVDRIRNAGDIEGLTRSRLRPFFPGRSKTNGARSRAVDLLDLLRRVQDLAAGRKVGPLDVPTELSTRSAPRCRRA